MFCGSGAFPGHFEGAIGGLILSRRRRVRIETERMALRPPQHSDFRMWAALRVASQDFLKPWEPTWAADHLTRKAFTNRVYWAQRSINGRTAVPLFLIRREDDALLGAITLDNIRRGPAQSGTLGYWVGQPHARQGYMREALFSGKQAASIRLRSNCTNPKCTSASMASRIYPCRA